MDRDTRLDLKWITSKALLRQEEMGPQGKAVRASHPVV